MAEQPYDKRDVMIKVAKLYYIEGMSQEQIAREVHVSRPTVSRLLKASIKEGIVQIRIDDVSSYGLELGRRIQKRFGIKQAIVTPSSYTVEESKINVGKAGARYLEANVVDGSLIGIAWGTTIHRLITNVQKNPATKVDVMQLVGGVGSKTRDTDANAMALSLANARGGTGYMLQAPFMVQSKILRDLLLDEPHIREYFRKAQDANVAIVGLGSTDPELSAHFRSGHITYEDVKHLRQQGAVGDICGRYIDSQGNECHTSLDDRIIAMSLEDLKNIPAVIGIAAGKEKKDIISGVLCGGYIDVLITDENAARAVLEMENGE